NTINNLDTIIKRSNIFKYDVYQIRKFNENIEAINNYLKKQLYMNKTIIICLKQHQMKTFPNYLESPYIITNENNIIEKSINIIERSTTRVTTTTPKATTKTTTTTTTTNSSTTTGKVATGDSTSVALLIGMLMLAGAGVVVARKRIAE
ncbi:MAG: LPXTG cell wall anchor domain-containing protein, partial [Acutalibacteraceae bacterium]|nr:LPXTG cell wall anchor domain-containing protein [Acutalibacteraceae bacterium]